MSQARRGAAAALGWFRSTPLRPVRRAAVLRERGAALGRLPRALRRHLDLDLDAETIEPLRVELGSGPFPTPGYVHVDSDWRARHLEYRRPVWDLPFGDGSVQEILAVHVLEHVHPGELGRTLREWRRILRPGGAARIHVPNAPAVFESFVHASAGDKWALTNALLGMWGGPEISSADDLRPGRNDPDHKALYDFDLLAGELQAAGFDEVVDLTGDVVDRHTEAWRPIVDRYSLVVEARVAAQA
jgi:predicted SAM-dependent methyltransferase